MSPATGEVRVGDRSNPYVGPRSITFGEPIYGRDVEIEEIRDLLVAERILLVYSPSGAGKSSIAEAGLRPRLEQSDFLVLPTIRVGLDATASTGEAPDANRYLLSSVSSLEVASELDSGLDPSELASFSLDTYLDRITENLASDRDPCLVFDQFEEVFTLDPTDLAAKRTFFEELGIALRNRGRWALFLMREDYIAQLDPYLSLLPTHLRTRYRLDLLTPEAARSAVQQPAEDAGVEFTDAAADRLIDDLRRVRVQRGTNVTIEHGPLLEPVQVQVVCRQLWSSLSL